MGGVSGALNPPRFYNADTPLGSGTQTDKSLPRVKRIAPLVVSTHRKSRKARTAHTLFIAATYPGGLGVRPERPVSCDLIKQSPLNLSPVGDWLKMVCTHKKQKNPWI